MAFKLTDMASEGSSDRYYYYIIILTIAVDEVHTVTQW